MIKKCKEESCIFNKRNRCKLSSIELDEDGFCISKEQT